MATHYSSSFYNLLKSNDARLHTVIPRKLEIDSAKCQLLERFYGDGCQKMTNTWIGPIRDYTSPIMQESLHYSTTLETNLAKNLLLEISDDQCKKIAPKDKYVKTWRESQSQPSFQWHSGHSNFDNFHNDIDQTWHST